MENLEQILKASKAINGFKIVTSHTETAELFFVGEKLETSREEDVYDTEVTIYLDKDNKRGSASFTVYPYMNKEDINKKIEENLPNCLISLNQFFELPKPTDEKVEEITSNLSDMSLKEAALKAAKAVLNVKQTKELTLNATEIFVYKITTNVKNSEGVDVSSSSYKINIELIPTYNGEKESVEVYFMFRSGELDENAITKEVENQLELVKQRQFAVPFKTDKPIRVLIEEDDNISGIMGYFIKDLNYASIYQHMNRQKVGDSMQGDIKGDKLNVFMSPFVKGVCNSNGIDTDGIKLHEIQIIKDGIAINTFGPNRFGQYIGVKNPTGNISTVKFLPGTLSNEELHKSPYLRCVKFSAIQMEENSGFFGGEVRLGFYFDGEKEIPVTGFTISGSMHEEKSKMRLSDEVVVGKSYSGPKFWAFEGMKVN